MTETISAMMIRLIGEKAELKRQVKKLRREVLHLGQALKQLRDKSE